VTFNKIVYSFENVPQDNEVDCNVSKSISNGSTLTGANIEENLVCSKATQSLDTVDVGELNSPIITPKDEDCDEAFKIGDKCVTLWHEDGVWYNATIKEISDEFVLVHFSDYGNEDHVNRTSILLEATAIPKDAEIDQNIILHHKSVEECKGKLKTGDTCVALWQEDGVWYNASVKEVSDSVVLVQFTDYGNEDHVKIDSIVLNPLDIPKDAEVDVNVNGILQGTIESSDQIQKNRFSLGDECIARWHEDNVWYNARIIEIRPDSAIVIFTDYENEDEVKLNYIVHSSKLIPSDAEIDVHVNRHETNEE